MNRIIGLIVNPVAGMGGSVGLKGTDGEIYKRAVELGAEPVTPKKTDEVLSHIKGKEPITLLVAPGKMGECYIRDCGMPFKVIGTVGKGTSKEDTKRISKEMVDHGAELLVFVGGDGTARDIYDAIGSTIPVVAVPAGVKVFSSVFAVSARAAAEMVAALQNPAYMRRNVGRVIAEKERVWKTLNELAMHIYPSTTNFLLAKTDIPDLEAFFGA